MSLLSQKNGPPMALKGIADVFDGRNTQKRLDQVERILETLVALGQAEVMEGMWRG